jgi:hypothetical protein
VRFDGAAPTVKPSPLLGQHVDDVLGSWLGMDAKETPDQPEDGKSAQPHPTPGAARSRRTGDRVNRCNCARRLLQCMSRLMGWRDRGQRLLDCGWGGVSKAGGPMGSAEKSRGAARHMDRLSLHWPHMGADCGLPKSCY